MSKGKGIVLRVQSAEGTKRIEISASSSTCQLYDQVYRTFGLGSYDFALYRERNRKDELVSSKSKTLRGLGVKHGDMLYLTPVNGGTVLVPDPTNAPAGEPVAPERTPSSASGSVRSRPSGASVSQQQSRATVVEDEVDVQLAKLDGKIERKRDPKYCRHNNNSRCFHCSALEPYDEEYLREQKIKHLSFHAYLRKMTSGVDRGKFLALEDMSCRIKNGCKDHPPWPKGICSKCQPNAITLNRQVYRHVDSVTFENTKLVETFLDYWRSTSHQRVGYLYGRYEPFADVPLGVRARVVAIYEPPQEGARDRVRLALPDPREPVVEELAAGLGLRRVGWIFTDLAADERAPGAVRRVRGADSHFLSAQECVTAGHFQNRHPNACRFASGGYFGSKFVTVCVTGDKSNQVHMEGYQVSNQCMALVRDDCLVPTKDAPELGYVRESTDKQYVPDVYYKEKDNYGNEVSRLARPLPVEYLLVDVPASTPVTPTYTFGRDPAKRPFPVENRPVDGHLQDFDALAAYLAQFGPDGFPEAAADFHLLLYVATMDMLPMRDYMGPLLAAVRAGDADAAREWARSEHWATVEQLIVASSPPPSRPGSVAAGSAPIGTGFPAEAQWTCSYCTYLNPGAVQSCEICNLPRAGQH